MVRMHALRVGVVMLGIFPVPWVLAAGETRDLERALLADAAGRDALQPAATAGHDGRFFLASGDGSMRLQIGALLQYRYNVNLRDAAAPDEDLTEGFDFRRTKLFFSGTVRPGIDYYIQGAFPSGGGGFTLEFAEMTHRFDNGVGVTWGQFKLPFLHEELVSEKTLLAADRSVMHSVFTAGVSEGVQLCSEGERFRVMGAVSDGSNACRTAYYDPAEADVALTGRAEFRFGEAGWKAFGAFTSFRGAPAGGVVGGAVHWQTSGGTGNTDTFAGTNDPGVDVLAYTVDAAYSGGGWSLYAAFVGRSTDTDGAAEFTDFGGILQGSVFVSERDEVFARWDGVFPDSGRGAGDDFNTLTLGVNHYFFPDSFAARLTADVQWFVDNQASSASLVRAPSGGGLLPSGRDDEVYLRVQMQVLF